MFVECKRMRGVINLLAHFATLRNRAVTILVSTTGETVSSIACDYHCKTCSSRSFCFVIFARTTGDTGPAAVHAVSNVANPLLSIIVHYPRGQISDFQRKQLTTVDSKFVKVVSFEGGGDDMDWPIKETLLENSDNVSPGERTFCGINSYNVGRPLLQMVHFVSLFISPNCLNLFVWSQNLTHTCGAICGEDLDLFENDRAIRF
jgi:hypothetical protein